MVDLAPPPAWWTPYAAVLRSRIRAQRSYRLSFAGEICGALVVGLVELAEVWVIFHNARVLGGLDLDAALLLFGLSNTGFALSQVIFGHLDTLPTLIPPLLPAWLAWLTPVAACWVWLLALGLWRIGTRHYQGGGG